MTRCERKLLDSLGRAVDECVRSGGIVVAALPTGYGKTSFIRFRLMDRVVKSRLRVAHVLPLRAIVRDAARRAAEVAGKHGGSDVVGFQAGLEVTGVDKSPYLARHYMIVTVDSFLLSFYGIPVYEMFRSAWHSDAAYALARSFGLLVLDEYHLMVAGDAGSDEGEVDLLAKQLASVSRAVADYVSSGRCVAVFTATLPPTILVETVRRASELIGLKPRVWVVAFGEKGGAYVKRVVDGLKPLAQSVQLEASVDSCFEACGSMATSVLEVPYQYRRVGEADVYIPQLEEAVYTVRDLLARRGCRRLNSLSVFVAFNSWRRAYAAYTLYSELFEKSFGCRALLLTGKMAPRDREGVLAALDEMGRSGRPVCLFATQVVEAGVDVSFDVLVTEAAPATALVQRAGRVSRYGRPGPCNAVVVLVDEKGGVDTVVQGVYDAESTRVTLDKLNACISSGGSFEWRCVDPRGCDAWNLVSALDEALEARFRPTAFYSGEEELEKLLTFTLPPRQVVEALDRVFDGSFVRSSALVPLLPIEALGETVGANVACTDVCETGLEARVKSLHTLLESIVTVDKGFLRSQPNVLCSCKDGRVPAVFTDAGGGPLVRVMKGVDARELGEKPLHTMWRLSRHAGNLIGFLAAEGVYEKGLGLKPVKPWEG